MSQKNISSSRETRIPAEIRSRRRIICNTPNITSGLSPTAQAAQALAQSGQQRPPGEGDDDLDDDGDFGGLSDRFASPAERQNVYQQPQQGFQPQPSAPPNAPQPFVDRPAYEGERQGGNDRGGFAPRQDRQGTTDFRTAVRDLIDNSRTATKDIGTIGRDAMAVRGISDPTAILSSRGKPAPRRRRRGLPSFITASPRINNPDPAHGRAVARAGGFAGALATPEAIPAGFESPAEGAAFPARGRRRRLRSPYGFGGAGSGEGEQPDATPETADDTPVSE